MAASGKKLHRRKILLLTGAPRRRDLSWVEEALTVQTSEWSESPTGLLSTSAKGAVRWRKLSLQQPYLHTGLTQTHWPEYLGPQLAERHQQSHVSAVGASNGLASDVATNGGPPIIANQQVARIGFYDAESSFASVDASMSTNASLGDMSGPLLQDLASVPYDVKLTNLVDIPTVEAIDKPTRPHSIVFNLLVIVLAISIRDVQLGAEKIRSHVGLARLTVADDTRSAFEIAVWLDCVNRDITGAVEHHTALRTVVNNLRRFDIILVQNVGLRIFHDKVHASSLSRQTRIHVLPADHRIYRRMIDTVDSAASAKSSAVALFQRRIAQKIVRIVDWRDNHQQLHI